MKRDINWFLQNPDKLLEKKPFVREGRITKERFNFDILPNAKTTVSDSSLVFKEISQDTYIQEYIPSLHRIKFNKSIPHISVMIDNNIMEIDDMTIQAAYQKNIHAAHVLHLTAKDMEFTLCNSTHNPQAGLLNKINAFFRGTDDSIIDKFHEIKQEWLYRDMKSVMNEVVSKQKKVADVGLLFMFDSKKNRGSVKVLSYDDGYTIIPNYNEYGERIACSIYYKTEDNERIIDVYDDTKHYRFSDSITSNDKSGFTLIDAGTEHGFSRCPLLYKRGTVAWEYSESTIEMWELMANINAVALKRFGTFGLVLTGQMNKDSFQKGNSTLIINLPSDTGGGKSDAKVLTFPEPQKMNEYLDFLKTEISTFSSVSFITPKDITSTGSGGNGIFLAMKNDLALATQSVSDWSPFTNQMIYLFQEMLSLESGNTNKYNDLKISAKLKPWSMESDSTKITNLSIESKWLSKQSIIEKSPDAAPDEVERIMREGNQSNGTDTTADKSLKIALNNSNEIQDPANKTVYNDTTN